MREWGRIGQGGTVRACTYPAQDEAEKVQARSISRKLRRGYIPVRCSREQGSEAVDETV
jgi:predicted DNA-binding WGR domain protein